ncbi:Hypothetical predicted protein [Mytilus galloprovincialis]|uniref:Peptidase S1 domain-containing protein n=1 Tax=Mytilus galloprovincialis TaxID=29158 RepID=A0A8B6FXT2_MYTGA|nr:Hypothetical predicted protein [Mytilus galloprovincialis]
MPDSKQLHLPCCLTKSSVYSTMVSELEGPTSQCISLSHFLLVWRTELRHIAIPRRSRFSECNTCVLLKNEIESTRNKEVRKQLMQQRDTHLKQQKSEREKYYKHAMKARRNPDKYLSIIMDAMDQAKTMIPHFTATPKFADGMWKLKTHLLGAIVHGIGAYGFFDIFQWPHGSNLTVSTLMNILFMMKDSLPEVLYLQMDNCGRENKNRYLMSFLAFLVELKIVVGIAGGEDADIEDFPYVARIEARDRKGEPWEDWCTAVILSETWLLTIARCLEDPLINRRVLAGFSDISDPNIQIRTIKHQKKHPHFDRKFKEKNDDALWENDIAVIELHTPLTFGPTVTSIPYSTSSDSVDLDNCQIAGWGEIDSNGTEPENLQFAEDITILTTEECRELNPDTPFVETQICVIDENRKIQPCFGDNGGPLACKTTDGTSTTVLSGIFAWQYTTCNANRSTVYTNIPLYADWIERQTGIEGYTLN